MTNGSKKNNPKALKRAISPSRNKDFPEWYQQVIKASEMAENSSVRGCMIIKPWGMGVWELLKSNLDKMIKECEVENAYFPLFIPLNYLQKEAEHVEGFAKECAVVTHHRLENKDGQLVPASPLDEPLIVRPTSETIIGHSMAKWIQSYRDLPLKLNQWANVVRWEMRPRVFLRTSEFLWQEGHNAFATKEEAEQDTFKMIGVYEAFAREYLALPTIVGEKSESERFPGAEQTLTIEAMMQDGKSLQAGTSHFLGQNFSKASGIEFNAQDGENKLAYTTSWGVSTRLIGAIIMCHGDDDGMRVPPRVAPQQVVVLPIINKEEDREKVLAYAQKIQSALKGANYRGEPVRCSVDKRDMRGGEKNWHWVKKGAPIRVEVGPRDVDAGKVVLKRRDRESFEKEFLTAEELLQRTPEILEEIQSGYYQQAIDFQKQNTNDSIENFEQFQKYFKETKANALCGFVLAPWSEDAKSEELLKPLKVTIRCLLMDKSADGKACVLTGKPAKRWAIFARSY